MMKNRPINAVIMAAGMSTRFVPLSLEKPKALLMLNDEPLIERQLRQLHEAGIDDITVVTGYMAEKFSYLENKYGVSCIYNPDYAVRNNHSSLYVARHKLADTFICSADNYFTENVFASPFVVSDTADPLPSYYAAEFSDDPTDEWCMQTDPDGRIRDVRIGGSHCLFMKGHAFLNKTFTAGLIPLLEEAYHSDKSADLFWEDLYIRHMERLPLYARPYKQGILYEFDSLKELLDFSPDYPLEKNSAWIHKLCRQFHTTADRITDYRPVKADGQTIGFTCRFNDRTYTFRKEEL